MVKVETFVSIVGYERYYLVSNLGCVYSVRHDKILKPILTTAGYEKVHLSVNGECKTVPIHRLVAQAFIPNPDNKPTVNHKNEIKTDNRAENLEWMTNREQNSYGTRTQRATAHTDYKSRNIDYGAVAAKHDYISLKKKLQKPIAQYTVDGSCIAKYDSLLEASNATGICQSHISQCANGIRKQAGGYIWKFERLS